MGYIIISTPGQSVCKHMVIGSSLDTTSCMETDTIPSKHFNFRTSDYARTQWRRFLLSTFCLQPYNSGSSRKVLCQYKLWRLTIAVKSFPKWMVKIFALFMWAIFPPLKPTSQDIFGGTLTCWIQAKGGIIAMGGLKWKAKGWIVAKDGKRRKPRAK